MIKGYKATRNYKCFNQIYEVGQEYTINQKPILCSKGFHYCLNARNTLNYYPYNHEFKLLEIEDLNPYSSITDGHKSCSNHIKIIKEITDPEELLQLLGFVRTFNKVGQILTHKNSNGIWRESTYDENGNELTRKNSYGIWTKFTYDENGNLLTFKDSDGYWRESTYDADGYQLTHKNSDGFWCESTYDENGNELTYKTSDGF